MIKAALEYLTQLATGNGPAVIDVHEGRETITKLIVKGVGEESEIKEFPITLAKEKKYSFTDLQSYIQFVPTLPKPIVVMVSLDGVYALGHFEQGREWHARLELQYSEEFRAISKAAKGVTQEELWRLLVTDLDGCVGPELLLAVSRLKMRANQEKDITINAVGLQEATEHRSLEITCTDPKGIVTAQVPLEIEWTGQVYTCLEDIYKLQLRVEVQVTDGKLIFTLHPRRLSDLKQKVVDAVHNELQAAWAGVEDVDVYKGEFYWI